MDQTVPAVVTMNTHRFLDPADPMAAATIPTRLPVVVPLVVVDPLVLPTMTNHAHDLDQLRGGASRSGLLRPIWVSVFLLGTIALNRRTPTR